jgi:aspartyl-tRNA(Asn)/glutamyl-tRNA(Gln) amidotransferase subunit B
MEEGNLRCDANVSVRPRGESALGTKVEIKNVNSLRFLQKAIDYEIDRQITVRETGGVIVQETRLWSERENRTYTMRTKEDAHDYRYFPDPDLPPLEVSEDWIARTRASLPELPEARRQRFIGAYGMGAEEAGTLTAQRDLADYFEAAAKAAGNPRAAANWILTELLRELRAAGREIDASPVTPEDLGALLRLIDDGTISGKIAKEVLVEMMETGETPARIIERKGLVQISDQAAIESIIDQVLVANPREVEAYRAGKTALQAFFVGQVMKATQGKANPKAVNELLRKKL